MLSVSHITLDGETTLSGVARFPAIGWKIHSDKRDVVQRSWHLQCSTTADFSSLIFDSGEVFSAQSSHIELGDIALLPSTRYYLQVCITDNQGAASAWSPAATFVTGLLDTPWQAAFISAESPSDKANSAATLLRKGFTLSSHKAITAAWVHATALGIYQLFLNGERVGNDELTPGWTSYRHHLCYQTYDVTGLLNQGDNVIGAELGAGWFKGDMGFSRHRNYYGEQTALLCQMVIQYEDGTQQVVRSDNSWRGSDSARQFAEIYDGEVFDACRLQPGWSRAGFNEALWRGVSVVHWDKNTLTAQGAGTVQQIERLAAKALIITPQGDKVLDFGQNMSGWVEFRVNGQTGDKVVLRHFETLDAGGNVYLDNLRTAKQTTEYCLNGEGEEVWHPRFSWQGFRYVKVEAYPGELNLDNFTAIVIHSAMAPTGQFACSNPDLNQLHHNILWGLKSNFVDVPTDCPQRDERLGWTGDAQIFCRTASYLMQTQTFFSKWLLDLKSDQTPEGGVPHVIPDILTGHCDQDKFLAEGGTHSATGWADAAVVNPWTMYLMYGDKRVLENQYASMKGWVDFMQAHADNDIWRYKLQFGDWVALDAQEGSYFGATPEDLICTAWYAHSTLLLAKAANVLGHTDDHRYYQALQARIVERFQQRFFTAEGEMTARTQTAHILALCFNLVPDVWRQRTADTLVELLHEHDGHLVTGFLGTPYFCHALSQNQHPKAAWALLLKEDFPSWLYQVKAGATTIWEHWDGIKPDGSMWSPDMNSFNHYAYGAVGEWLYRTVAGIEADETAPGFKHAMISPLPGGGLSWVNAHYQSIYGDIAVKWQAVKGRVVLTFSIPANTTATIKLSAVRQLLTTDTLNFAHVKGEWSARCGSGEYQIEYLPDESVDLTYTD
ncbi:alpha-L-rhamnosidase [Lelliottia sp. CFBP8978]|uniref:alpha-L-rhamnosidase n=1 Tax=Lelliottia sp. CFBP8978 TaxID=3096522 RepID=UPI002A6995DD|nr:family 78 glycoside hydrolase catalytic domain [Lelliottia sp. CFBP8978]MDY1035994.1 family 78 glycoside hydrolase catalytic domain [Lelliottia sp. CFBP8978]